MLESWLRLIYLRGISLEQKRLLVKRLGSPESIFKTSSKQLHLLLKSECTGPRYGNSRIQSLPDAAHLAIEQDIQKLNHHGAGFVSFTDPNYPPLLNHTDSAPLGLFYLGRPELLNTQQIAIVGSRHAARSGMETAWDFASKISAAGFTITSGLAKGIDASAHRGALETTGKTIAVMATGIDRIYPAVNRVLHQQISKNGLIVTEHPPGTPPRKHHFPQRNRIISGLSLGTLVVEAGLRSGSLITARLAAEQGRDVFAVPGSIHDAGSRGCHYLLRQGAALVESVDDIFMELNWCGEKPARAVTIPRSSVHTFDPCHQLIFDLIEFSPCSIDKLITLSGLTAEQVSSILIRLELQGLVSESTGGYQKLPGAAALSLP
ncbi:MAG: DNA-processing protein DprA [Arenicellales bacterium]